REVLPQVQDFLRKHADEDRPLVLDMAAHASIAFAAGWVLEAKSGLDVRVRQRMMGEGVLDWHPKDGPVPEGPLWRDESDLALDGNARDLAVALAVSQATVPEEALDYVQRKGLPVGRILKAVIAPEPGPRSVAGGAHSLRLAQSLIPRIRQRRPHERGGSVHLFSAAPNALVFYLGQLSRSLGGRIVLYEYPFGEKDSWGRDQRSIELEVAGRDLSDW
ncbi:MAG TPA: SAVED domain-containing protein, partial [Thermoanaerobaculia bacterium]|nr:SAVED domain-containing protein [Thermoanaerobaculia bacterium]